jgi:hypothetical protein
MIWLVDDRHVGELLRTGHRPFGVRRLDQIFTTGYWYVRLCQAVLDAAYRRGVLSEPFFGLPEERRKTALAAVAELPAAVGLASLRELTPVIGRLRIEHSLNVLSSEVLAASIYLDARVLLSVTSPRLEAALASEGRRCVVRAP